MKFKFSILIAILIAVFAFAPVVDAGPKRDKQRKEYRDDRRGGDRDYHHDRGHGYYHRPPKWHKHRRRQPHIPNYRRHHQWRDWGEWDRHYKRHPRKYRGGKYHYDKRGHLMFSFCESGGTCFSFSFYD